MKMAGQMPPSVQIDFEVRRLEDDRVVGGLFLVNADRVEITIPGPLIGTMTRDEAANLAQALIVAIQRTGDCDPDS
jgi:hypothetical protein